MPNMYQEYLENYIEQTQKFGKKVAIFLMVGIFYEMYDVMNPETGETRTSFLRLIDILGLKVSVKKGEGPDGLDGLVAGIPDYSVHKWAGKLTQLGWTVVLVEQVKNSSGKVIERKMERILTPGTHVEAANSSDIYITFISLKESTEGPLIAVSALDLTTGHLHIFETQAQGSQESWTSNDLIQFMELYPPKEILWSVEGSSRFKETINEIKLKHILGSKATFYKREPLTSGAWLNTSFREDFLRNSCSLKSLLPTHVALYLAPGSRSESALISLLACLKDLWPSLHLGQLLVFPWTPGSTLCLGENALVQLHMIVQDTEKQDVLSLLNKTSTAMGYRGLKERLLKPSANSRIIQSNLDSVEKYTQKNTDIIVKRLKSMTDIDRLYRKIQQGNLQASDLINLDTSLKASLWIATSEEIKEKEEQIHSIRNLVFNTFSVDKIYASSDDHSLFMSGLVIELDQIEELIAEQFKLIHKLILEISTSISINHDILKPDFREGSLVIKGPRGILQTLQNSGKLPDLSIVKINKTGSYIESPTLDQIFHKITRLRENLKKKQSISLIEHGTRLSNELFTDWFQITDWITNIDVDICLARVARENGYVKPHIIHDLSEGSINIEGLRHPLLEAQDKQIPYVQHTVQIGVSNKQGWLLYGLNASGKSSLMRSVGLAVLLAQGGSFVPASSMTISPFSSLHTRIINTDNLWMGLSSFAVEMSEMREIFRDAGPKSLVLGDELCSGTETTSATALVAAGLRGLIRRNARFLFATHLHSLSKIEEVTKDPRLTIWHLHVEYDKLKDKLVYHRILRPGPGSSLYGLEVAKAMKIPDDILEDAIQFRKLLAGESELSGSIGSSWNSSIVRIKCESCGSMENSDLEVHHIKERNLADKNGILPDGSKIHRQSNLIVLCEMCHDKVHGGTLEIGTMIQTSDGMERSVTTVTSTPKKSKWSDEHMEIIQSSIVKFPNLSASGLSKYLLNQHSIQISGPSIRKIMNS